MIDGSRMGKFVTQSAPFSQRYAPVLIILLAVLLRVLLLPAQTVSGFQYSGWRQTDTASIAHNFLHNGFQLLYPQINWGGNGPGYVETEFQLFPFLVALLYGVFGEHVVLGLLVSLLFALGTFIFFYAFASRLVSRPAAILALLFFTISPLEIPYSVAFMPESTVLFFYIVSLYLFQKWLEEDHFTDMILAAASTAMAVLVKATSIHIGIIFFLLLLQKYHLSMFRKWYIWLFAVISLLPGLLWYLHARDIYLTYGNTFGIISGGDSKFDNLNYWFSPSFYSSLIQIEVNSLFAVGGILPFVTGVVLSCRKRKPMILLFGFIAIVIYYMLIPRYTSFVDYYHIFALPFAALSIGIGFHWLFQNVRLNMSMKDWGRPLLGILTIAIMVNPIFRVYRRDTIAYIDHFWECAQHVAELVPPDKLIIVSTTSGTEDANGVSNNYQEPMIFFYSQHYGWSLPADWHNASKVQEFRQGGALYLVMYDKSLYESNEAFAQYLEKNAEQIGPGFENRCAIYKFS